MWKNTNSRIIKHKKRYSCIRRKISFVYFFSLKAWSTREGSHHPATHTILALSTQWGVLLQGSKSVGSVQNFILFFSVWCESRELRSKGSSRSSCVTSVVENFPDRVAFIILPNISDGVPPRKQPTALTLVSRCLAFAFVSLCSMLCFFSPSMNLFCTFICLTFFKFFNILL